MASQALNELREQVDAWRKKQGKRTMIPEELWNAAVLVARVDGVWATARATRFNYEKLARLAASVQRPGRAGGKALAVIDRPRGKQPTSVGPAFVELAVSTMGGAVGTGRTIIDVMGRQGDRMRIDVGGVMDVVGLVQTLWSRQS
jgi:hypothetical protein